MTEEQARLWQRIAAYTLDDPGAAFTFTHRLSRENRWSLPYARRVVFEYRRFLFLAMAAGHPVTPSDQVDQAWHLHLTYTRSYWNDLCPTVLGRPLHHGPTQGGAQESAKFHDWYGRTLDSYRRLFGEEPPSDIWPSTADRFGRDLHFARVNTATHWVLPRPATILRDLARRWRPSCERSPTRARPSSSAGRRLTMQGLAMLAALPTLLAGCREAWVPAAPPPGWADLAGKSGSEFLELFVPLTIGSIVCSLMLRKYLASRQDWVADPEFCEPTCKPWKYDPYALILLAQGPDHTVPVQAAAARLVDQGFLAFDKDAKRFSVGSNRATRTLHPVERALHDSANRRRDVKGWELVKDAAQSEAVRDAECRLRLLGWIPSLGHDLALRLVPLLPIVAVLLLGLWRIDLGLQRGKPVGFLVFLCLVLAIAALGHLIARTWRTPRGEAVIAALDHKRPLIVSDPPTPSDPQFLLAFALLGLAALPGDGMLASLRQELIPPPTGGDGSGCGGDVGGGGCGGGGGGCGGCGGCGG